MKRIATLAMVALAANTSFASQLVYLSCELPPHDGAPATRFDFTLDEQNGTVSYHVPQANATNKEKAVFGPQTVTWSNNMSYGSKINRTINRTDLSFVQEMDIAGIQRRQVGTCSLVTPTDRKF
jgi:hypothetical protein